MGRKTSIVIDLTEREERLLFRIINSGKTPSNIRRRASFVYHFNKGLSFKEICANEKADPNTVKRWLNKWDAINELDETQNKIGDTEFIRLIYEQLTDSKRSGRKPRLTAEEKIQVQTLSCQDPQDYDVPITEWSHESLSEQAKKMGIEISSSHVGRLLKKRIKSS
ncbi:helix-turn-helix domain-containing protein [Persicobacter psychrovividus]|uniref:Transposase n=2 Tax=Persicobacter psychrovividus TaxID=387638 RepID=A0ABN6LBS3_9BACT|nr:hypothetical protein PEPS_00930 [Persicobacter psychrovividus]BDC99863.1 hypothetical protein PEPS_21440 [Persicobacter psychrovividus]BDD00264.1 hypothetical protein PEPS_25440 [Persicobacter psychrovividus]BDD00761.1 hypothetical protein PEPS_30410 [Persicobacter psychrovividus]BDD01434.1 hypothetical protein PEPS_37140 [Persicobacter psychrovividus]